MAKLKALFDNKSNKKFKIFKSPVFILLDGFSNSVATLTEVDCKLHSPQLQQQTSVTQRKRFKDQCYIGINHMKGYQCFHDLGGPAVSGLHSAPPAGGRDPAS